MCDFLCVDDYEVTAFLWVILRSIKVNILNWNNLLGYVCFGFA